MTDTSTPHYDLTAVANAAAARAVELYAQRHPRPPQVNVTQAAKMLGLSRPTVHKLMKAGKLTFNSCGQIPIEQVDRVLASNYA
ncbi:helix-turn-helix domain-containing protein [Achromobacter xylosoxidans]|uniref:helix-turn-helix domain-containing protein n=1 Tax=Alcaligenes xylosoxydans xylosoxydans TaxID=85698 RepID=UPI0032E4A320